MEFHLTRKQTDLSGQWILQQPKGEIVGYEEPLHYQFLPQLMKALGESSWGHQFHGYFYRLRTNSGLIEEFVPASEHYKKSWFAMSQTFHGAVQSLDLIESNIKVLRETYPAQRTTLGIHNQPWLIFTTELYRLRADFSTLLFLIRSILDQFASLVQFLTGPKSSQFKSFADVVKKCKGLAPPPEIPSGL